MINWEVENIDKNLEILSRLLNHNQITDYIHYIQFPFFKNIENGSRVNFTHPITILTGKNGLGKSSCLHALYGTPKNYVISDFWFSTAVDPIKESGDPKGRNCYFYAYGIDKKEVLYTRIHKKDKPDYWETSRPLVSLGMEKHISTPENKTRNSPLKKEVVYIDFRSELSPYDQYYYFSDLKLSKRVRTKQDFIRERSKFLKEVLITNSKVNKWRKIIGHKPVALDENELNAVKFILDKNYNKAVLIKHNFFMKNFSNSIIFYRNDFDYSEAHAGSGEISVVKIVKSIFEAPDHSLILLDEPEVSLHPQAQKRLMIFLSKMAIQKKLQIVISTHSSDIVELLTPSSIKLLFQPRDEEKVKILENIKPTVTFNNLGRTVSSKKLILVEDTLAKLILEKVIQFSDDQNIKNLENTLEIQFFPGGESYLKTTFIPIAINSIPDSYIVFDGDQKHSVSLESIKLSDEPEEKKEELESLIYNLTTVNIKNINFGRDSDNNEEDMLIKMKQYVDYYKENVTFLPKSIPEDILWKEEIIATMIDKVPGKDFNYFDSNYGDSKKKLYELCKYFEKKASITDLDYTNFLVLLIREWIYLKDEDYSKVLNILEIF